ncbi:MAG: hypothetical protein ACTSRG_13080 [Candidatus Helarchaeota archaeon]
MKITKENATIEFNKIVEHFGFYVPEEAKTQKIETVSGGMTLSLQQDIDQAAVMIQKIREGKIEFDEKDEKIIYNFRKPIMVNEENISSLRFGEFTMGQLEQAKIDIRECNVGNMTTTQRETVLMSMTGQSDEKIFKKLSPTIFNDLWTIAGYFFS